MKKSDENALESIARNEYHDASYIGTDGEGADHTATKRGNWAELLVSSGGMVGMIDATVEVGA